MMQETHFIEGTKGKNKHIATQLDVYLALHHSSICVAAERGPGCGVLRSCTAASLGGNCVLLPRTMRVAKTVTPHKVSKGSLAARPVCLLMPISGEVHIQMEGTKRGWKKCEDTHHCQHSCVYKTCLGSFTVMCSILKREGKGGEERATHSDT